MEVRPHVRSCVRSLVCSKRAWRALVGGCCCAAGVLVLVAVNPSMTSDPTSRSSSGSQRRIRRLSPRKPRQRGSVFPVANYPGPKTLKEAKFLRREAMLRRSPFDVSHATLRPELDALQDLYDATGGPHWTLNDRWPFPAHNVSSPFGISSSTNGDGEPASFLATLARRRVPPGLWHGVSTDSEGFVISINLSWNNCTGTIPAALGTLTRLRTLNLAGNALVREGIAFCTFMCRKFLVCTSHSPLHRMPTLRAGRLDPERPTPTAL